MFYNVLPKYSEIQGWEQDLSTAQKAMSCNRVKAISAVGHGAAIPFQSSVILSQLSATSNAATTTASAHRAVFAGLDQGVAAALGTRSCGSGDALCPRQQCF
jgi:hypothetical protein